ncbi:hypothetical protein QD460_32315 [Rhizobium jaguaris]|uniref:hypothetical protein n=1 Tax=Rhizobium jaguaris TaxID=1312183 RepID=UPI0039BFBB99
MVVGQYATDEEVGVVAGKDEAGGAVVEVAGDVEGEIVACGKLTGVSKRRQAECQVMCGKQRGAGRCRKAGGGDGDIAGAAGIDNGAYVGVGEVGIAGDVER